MDREIQQTVCTDVEGLGPTSVTEVLNRTPLVYLERWKSDQIILRFQSFYKPENREINTVDYRKIMDGI